MSVMRKMLPNKICWCCVEFDPGIKVVMALTMLLRFISMVIGCFYGPYLYLVLPLGGLYLAADALLFYAVNTALKAFRQDDADEDIDDDASYKFPQKPARAEDDVDEGTTRCDFPTVKVWLAGWLAMDLVGIVGIAVCIGLFADLGTWSMTHDPIHMALFVIIIILEALLIWTGLLLCSLYLMLRDQWLMGLLGNNFASNQQHAGLTHGGQRIQVH